VTLHGVEFGGFDQFVGRINRAVGDQVFSKPGATTLGLVAVAGLALFIDQIANGDKLTGSAASPILAVVTLRILSLASVGPNETARALVNVRNRRQVGRFGVGFYWGALTFYVDASEALFLTRRTRMLQSAAGILSDFFCGLASTVAISGGNALWGIVLREFAVLGYLNIVINSVPLLELDGYWILADALDRPTLQRDARQAWLRSCIGGRPIAALRSMARRVLPLASSWWALGSPLGGVCSGRFSPGSGTAGWDTRYWRFTLCCPSYPCSSTSVSNSSVT
jgi:hypothetical protein